MRTRLVVGLVVVVIGIVLGVAVAGSTTKRPAAKPGRRASHHATVHTPTAALPAVESGLLPWTLTAPLSRAVVLPGAGNQLVVLGGLTTGDTSSSGVYTLDTSNGALTPVGDLSSPLHDASGAVIAGKDVVFGGGGATTVGTVQTFPSPTGSAPTAGAPSAATVVASLPQPRSDSSAATIGATSYVIGGFDGTTADAVVLGTTDGHTFFTVATLLVPVRYAAVTAADGKIYVFGGQAVSGADAGQPIDAVQVIDPAHHSAVLDGHPSRALEWVGSGHAGRPRLRGRGREHGAPTIHPRDRDHPDR